MSRPESKKRKLNEITDEHDHAAEILFGYVLLIIHRINYELLKH